MESGKVIAVWESKVYNDTGGGTAATDAIEPIKQSSTMTYRLTLFSFDAIRHHRFKCNSGSGIKEGYD
jgi:hypothetical protein